MHGIGCKDDFLVFKRGRLGGVPTVFTSPPAPWGCFPMGLCPYTPHERVGMGGKKKPPNKAAHFKEGNLPIHPPMEDSRGPPDGDGLAPIPSAGY